MQHKLAYIAEVRKFDEKDFIQFALRKENYNQFGIINEAGVVTVSTWYNDKLVAAYRQHLQTKNKNV